MAVQSDTDLKRLIDFLDDLNAIFAYVARFRGELLPTELAEIYPAAWNDGATAIQLAKIAIEEGTVDATKLEAAGLTGASLALKLTGFNRAMTAFRTRPLRYLFRRILKWANTLLGSLAVVLEVLHLVKELKEAVEHGMDEGEDELKKVARDIELPPF